MSRYKDKIVDKKQGLRREMAFMSDAEKIEYLLNKQAGTEILLEEKENQTRLLVKTNQALQTDAHKDSLTGLNNLRYLNLIAPAIIEAATPDTLSDDEEQIYSLVEVFADVNGLGAINKQYGDEYGDKLLQAAATALKKHFRRATDLMAHNDGKENVIARKGGDEMLLLLRDTSIQFIKEAMADINNSTYCQINGHRIDVKFSFGYSVYTGQKDLAEMHTESDRQMQSYKKTAPKSQVSEILPLERALG